MSYRMKDGILGATASRPANISVVTVWPLFIELRKTRERLTRIIIVPSRIPTLQFGIDRVPGGTILMLKFFETLFYLIDSFFWSAPNDSKILYV